MNNLNDAARQLRRHPGLSVITIATLALGIGAPTAIFSLFHRVLVRPLPVPEPDRLVRLSTSGPLAGYGSILSVVVLAASYVPARRASTVAPMEALR